MHYRTEFVDISDYLPESLIVKGYQNLLGDFSVDTMLLDGHTMVCLSVDGRKFANTSNFTFSGGFDCTGHYPILAGYTPTGEPLYVAVVHVDLLWHFTTVIEGAPYADYFDEVGGVLYHLQFLCSGFTSRPQ